MILLQPQPRYYEEYLGLIKEYGFGFEVTDFMYPAVLDHKRTHAELYERYRNVPVNALHGPFIDLNYSGGDRKIFRVSKLRLEQCAGHAREMNVRKIVVHSCFFPVLTSDDVLYDLWSEESGALLTEIAKSYGVFFCIENVLDRDPDIIVKMLAKSDPECVGVCLDIGHTNFSAVAPQVWLKRLAPHIRHIHLSDNGGYYDDHIALGTGTIDWESVLRVMREEKIDADCTIEVKTTDYVRQSVKLLRELDFI